MKQTSYSKLTGGLSKEKVMCLATARKVTPTTLVMDGWKLFYGSETNLKFRSSSLTGSSGVSFNVWLKAEEIEISASDGTKYMTGFHVYDDYEQVRKLADIRRVYYRNVTYIGKQDKESCIIAQEMYVPSNPEGWPPLDVSVTKSVKKKTIVQKLRDAAKKSPGNA
jgi:hypothetical protein